MMQHAATRGKTITCNCGRKGADSIIKKISFKDQVYEYLKKAIINGELKTGEIYSEQMFADQLNVSRTPVREAVLQLKNEDMLEVYNNRGIMVKPLLLEDVQKIIQTRLAIEGYSIRYLAQRIETSEAQAVLQQMQSCLEQEQTIPGQAPNVYEFMKSDVGFHGLIVRFTQNEYFVKTMDMLHSRLEKATVSSLKIKDRTAATLEEHQEIIRQIQSGDGEKAYEAFEYHMNTTAEIMRHCQLN